MKKIELRDIAKKYGGEYIRAENCVKFKDYCVVANGYFVDITVSPTDKDNYYYVDTHCDMNAPLGRDAFTENGDVNFNNIFKSSAYVAMQNAGRQFSKKLHEWIVDEVSG